MGHFDNVKNPLAVLLKPWHWAPAIAVGLALTNKVVAGSRDVFAPALAPQSKQGNVNALRAPAPTPASDLASTPAQSFRLMQSPYDMAPVLDILASASFETPALLTAPEGPCLGLGLRQEHDVAWVTTLPLTLAQPSPLDTYAIGDGIPGEATLSYLTQSVTLVANQQAARSARLVSATGGVFAFHSLSFINGSLAITVDGGNGRLDQVSNNDINLLFPDALNDIFSFAAQKNVSTIDTYQSFYVPSNTSISAASTYNISAISAWIKQTGSPVVAYTQQGDSYLATSSSNRATDDNAIALTSTDTGKRALITITASQNLTLSMLQATDSQASIAFVAVADTAAIHKGERLDFAGLDATARIKLRNRNGESTNVEMAEFKQAFGESAVTALVTQISGEPVQDQDVLYLPPPNNAVFFSATLGSDAPKLVRQGQVGDCFVDSVIAGMLARNLSEVASLVQPSQDGHPNHIDISLYPIGQNGRRIVTVTNRLAVNSDSGLATVGDQIVVDDLGTPQIGIPLLEKGLAMANQIYAWNNFMPGYQGIDGGFPSQSMQVLTGLDAVDYSMSDMTRSTLWGNLTQIEQGRLVVLSTPSHARVPGDSIFPGLAIDHAYTVLATANDTAQRVKLRNPWGAGVPDGTGGVNQQGNGEFWLSLRIVHKSFLLVSVGG